MKLCNYPPCNLDDKTTTYRSKNLDYITYTSIKYRFQFEKIFRFSDAVNITSNETPGD